MFRPLFRTSAVAVLLLTAGCFGSSELSVAQKPQPFQAGGSTEVPSLWTGDPETDAALVCDAPTTPGFLPMRRLSHLEYRYAVEDLFGDAALGQTATRDFVSDPLSLGFSNSASLLDVKPVLGGQYLDAAERVAESVTANLTPLLPCNPTSAGELNCATSFIRSFVKRAFRRPLTAEEEQTYVAGYTSMRTQFDFKTGIEWVVSTVLVSPSFLYRPEIDQPEDFGAGSVRPLRPLELASRISFLVWHSIPDDALIAAAIEGRLSTPQDVDREIGRLLADPRAMRSLNFYEEWLDLNRLDGYARDATVFASMPSGLPNLFRSETKAFLDHVFQTSPKLSTLLTADYTFANATLASHYGLAAVTGTAFVKTPLPPNRRGIWMQGGPLTTHDKQNRTSIVNRGLRARTMLLCHNIPAPPDNVSLSLGPVDQTASQADRLAQHRTDPSCASCHRLLDPIGQVFETFDAVGKPRQVDEAGHPIVASGELTATRDADGPVADAVSLMAKLSESQQVKACITTQLFRYANGRVETPADACSQKQAYDRFAASGFDLRELLIGIALSDAFLTRSRPN